MREFGVFREVLEIYSCICQILIMSKVFHIKAVDPNGISYFMLRISVLSDMPFLRERFD